MTNDYGRDTSMWWFLFIYLFAAKSFIASVWSIAWERAPGWFKGCLVAAGRGPGTI